MSSEQLDESERGPINFDEWAKHNRPRGIPYIAHMNNDLTFSLVAAGEKQVDEYMGLRKKALAERQQKKRKGR